MSCSRSGTFTNACAGMLLLEYCNSALRFFIASSKQLCTSNNVEFIATSA